MNKLILSTLGGLLIGSFLTTQFANPLKAQEGTADEKSTYEYLDLFGEIFERVKSGYVEGVDDRKLIESAINGMLSSLDPHSSYMPPEAFDDMQVQTRGEFGGLGIEVTQESGFVKVVTPMDGTPASEAGIQPGDFITHVDGENLLGLTLDEAVDMMRGPVGSEIVITVVREGEEGPGEPFDVSLVRDTIELQAVKARVEDGIVVLRITTFNDKTYPELKDFIKEKVDELNGMENVKGFVVDLRNNPGGLLTQAILVSDAFLDRGEIVSTRGRDNVENERYNAEKGDLAEGKPLIVLVNGGSASASEIVAGALQDHHRAVIVGTKTFGKGSVQTVVPIPGEGAMRLTTARYYTPSGRSIQALGVTPDIIVEQNIASNEADTENQDEGEDQQSQIRSEADLRGSLDNDSLSDTEREQLEKERADLEAAAKRRSEDPQFAFAVDLINGLDVLEGE